MTTILNTSTGRGLPDPEYRAAFGDFLRLKYKGQRFDLVIAMSELALEFIDTARSALFRDTPVVFFANFPATRRLANSTGVIAELTLGDTVALATELQPDVRQVFVVSGADAGDDAVRTPGAGAAPVV